MFNAVLYLGFIHQARDVSRTAQYYFLTLRIGEEGHWEKGGGSRDEGGGRGEGKSGYVGRYVDDVP